MQGVLAKMGEEVALLDSWYQADTNHVPPVSVLQVATVQYSTVQSEGNVDEMNASYQNETKVKV